MSPSFNQQKQMKTTTHTLITAAITACFAAANAAVTRYNAFHAAWFAAKEDGMSPKQFRQAVLDEFDAEPWYTPVDGVEYTDELIETAVAKARRSIESSLTQLMPKIDGTVDWSMKKPGSGRKTELEKHGITPVAIKEIRVALAGCDHLTAEAVAFILHKLGVA